MARGWESKSVEQQQADAVSERARKRIQLTPEEIEAQRRLETLELSRRTILQQLEHASNPRYQEMLQAALKELEGQIARVKVGGTDWVQ